VPNELEALPHQPRAVAEAAYHGRSIGVAEGPAQPQKGGFRPVESRGVEIGGKTAIVTGGARGIGRSISARLAAEGAQVLVVDQDESAGRTTADELEAGFLRADVTKEADVRAMIGHAERELGALDILANNAGGYEQPVFPDAPLEHWSRTLELNLIAVMLGIHYAVPAMAGRGGAIVNVASSAGLGLAPHPGPEYAAAKAGVIRLTAALAPLAERRVRVNCVCPHTVATEKVLATIARLEPEGAELPPPLRGELIEPEEISDAVAELIRNDDLAGRVMVCWGGKLRRLLPNEEAT
jgi:NAD(P)-dependent dehydrogenase (short-subunit alcohol dehydrogenase family)